jgi:hypothetical protein|tara:strand:- start:9953 stop:10516 length:564 start_codon:yes stop_codon:yes gene_type:complete
MPNNYYGYTAIDNIPSPGAGFGNISTLGARRPDSINLMFQGPFNVGSPIEMSSDEIQTYYQANCLDATALDGYLFQGFNADFDKNGPPLMSEVETGGDGKPGTPYIPNLNSPGETNGLANAQAPYTGPRGKVTDTGAPDPAGASTTWGSGKGIQNDPLVTSNKIAAQTIGDYPSITAGLSTAYSEST